MRWTFLVILLTTLAGFSPGQSPPDGVSGLYSAVSHSAPDQNAAANLSDVVMIRGGQEFSLTRGTLRLLVPVGGRVFGGVFTGEGTFTLYPPTPVERAEFERETTYKLQDGKYIFHFDRAVLWFNDTLLHELGPAIRFGPMDIQLRERDAIDVSLRYATDRANENVLYHLI